MIMEVSERKENFCVLCKKSYASGSALKTHIKVIHEKVKYKCDLCEKSFTAKLSLEGHVKRIHEKMKELKCEICEKKFGSLGGLNEHSYNIHQNNSFICELCDKSFKCKKYLKIHTLSHEGTKTFQLKWKKIVKSACIYFSSEVQKYCKKTLTKRR